MIVWPVEILQNKYTRWYEAIIKKGLEKNLPKRKGKIKYNGNYTELHHIVPRSFGGVDDVTNLVRFTAREHFVCHWLLTKMTTGSLKAKMITALIMMTGEGSKSARYENINKNSKWYEKIKTEYASIVSAKSLGRKLSPEAIEKIRIRATGRKRSEACKKRQSERLKGKPRILSEAGRKNLIDALRNRVVVVSEETRKKHSINNTGQGNPFYGKKHTPETMEKMLAYHNNPEVKKAKSERVSGDKNPSKDPAIRKKMGKTQKERLARDRFNGTGSFSPEARANMSKATRGSKNGNAKTFEIIDPNGKIYMVTGGLKKFCKENNLSYDKIVGKTEVVLFGWSIKFIPKDVINIQK